MFDFSEYKLSTDGTVNMSAKTYKDLFIEVIDALAVMEEDFRYQTGITVAEPTVATGDRLYATDWNTLIGGIRSKAESLASYRSYQIEQNHWSTVVSLATTKSAGSTISVGEWNQMVDELSYTLSAIHDLLYNN